MSTLPGILHIAICAKPPPNPVTARPAVKWLAPVAVAITMKPMQQTQLPNNRNSRRPNRSEFAPASKNPILFAVVYAGTYHALDVGAPNSIESLPIMAAVVGTGQNDKPKVEESTKITNHVFQVAIFVLEGLVCGRGSIRDSLDTLDVLFLER
jgi:hypothetical protein